jgi:hypothetical protein
MFHRSFSFCFFWYTMLKKVAPLSLTVKAAELAEDVRFLHLVLLADVLDTPDDLADHVIHIEAEVEAVLDG